MKYVYLALFALVLFVVDPTPSLAQGACPGPTCRSASAAAAGAASAKAADDKRKAQQAASKTAKANENPARGSTDNSSGAQNKKQPVIRPPCDPMSGSCRQRGSMGIRG